MNYQIKLSSQATKFLKKVPRDVGARILKKMHEVEREPFRYLEHFEGDSSCRVVIHTDLAGLRNLSDRASREMKCCGKICNNM